MLVSKLCQLDLRAYAIGTRNEQRIGHLLGCSNGEEAAEATDITHHFIAIRPVNSVFDRIDRTCAFSGIDSSIGIGGSPTLLCPAWPFRFTIGDRNLNTVSHIRPCP